MKKYVSDLDEKISAGLMLVILIIAFLNVVSRYFIHASFSFTEELTTVLYVLIALLGAASGVKHASHFVLDILTNIMKPNMKRVCAFISDMVGSIICVIISVLSVSMVMQQYKIGTVSTSMHIPQWIYGLTIPIGMFFLAGRYIQHLIHSIKELAKGGSNA